MRKLSFNLLLVFFMGYIFVPGLFSQEEKINDINELKKKAPKVYIDCSRCDIDYIRTEITFVNYVRDRKEADIHVLITTQRTGSGGREYTLAFIGQKEYADIQNTLIYISHKSDTEDEVRKGLVRVLKMGLIGYAARTPIANQISIKLEEKVKATSVEDKWNFWVFSISLHSFLNGQKTSKFTSIYGSISANRITPESKLRLGLSANFDESRFDIDETTSISSSSESRSLHGLYVKSLNDHWSIGGWFSLAYSSYRNIEFAINPAPAIEYNIFPYSESTRRQLRLLYKFGYSFSRYKEETIYDKISENLLNECLSATLELKEPWGTVTTSLEGSHYFHDFSKYRFNIFGELSFRIFKGLSLNVFGSYSRIHDQLSLPKGGATFEEILLRRKELSTDYSYFASIGLSYSFGSIYSNVVNPRFGNGGRSIRIIM